MRQGGRLGIVLLSALVAAMGCRRTVSDESSPGTHSIGVHVSSEQTRVEVPFQQADGAQGIARFDRPDPSLDFSMTIRSHDGTIRHRLKKTFFCIEAIRTVDPRGDGQEDILVVTTGAGSGSAYKDLNLIRTADGERVTLTLGDNFQLTEAVTEVSTSENFNDPRLRREREFLENIKHEYGYVGEQDLAARVDDPEYACYFWAKDNGDVEDGPLTIRRYAGKTPYSASITDALTEGDIVHTAYFKGPVVAHDTSADKHFVVFHPDWMYAWPTILRKTGPYLIIGTRGEGVAVVNVKTWRLTRYRFGGEDYNVGALEMRGSKVIVNDKDVIDLPGF